MIFVLLCSSSVGGGSESVGSGNIPMDYGQPSILRARRCSEGVSFGGGIGVGGSVDCGGGVGVLTLALAAAPASAVAVLWGGLAAASASALVASLVAAQKQALLAFVVASTSSKLGGNHGNWENAFGGLGPVAGKKLGADRKKT